MNPKDYKDIVYKIIGAAMKVHNNLGSGLLEPIYNEALTIELDNYGIIGEAEKYLPCYYKKKKMKKFYKMDIVIDDIVVELKSVQNINSAHRAQLFNYLRLTRKPIGLLINFGGECLQGERYAYDDLTNNCYLLDKNMDPVPIDDIDEDEWYEDPYADIRMDEEIHDNSRIIHDNSR